MASTSLQVAGLASGFDWKSFLDQVMAVERAPIDRLDVEKGANSQKVALLDTLGSRLTALQNAAEALRTSGVFARRSATSSTLGSNWKMTAGAETPTGTYRVAVSQLATAASLAGSSGIAAPLSATAEGVADLTVATLPMAQAVTAGTFSVNGKQVSVALTDSLQDVFDAISAATSGTVSASYDPAADRVTLTSTSGTLMLGASNDTSSFLSAFKLGNNGTAAVTSDGRLGAVKRTAALANSNLTAAIGADESGNGAFSINGVSVSYNVNTDTLSAVLKRINDSAAGVTATYDARNGRLVLANDNTGDVGISAADTSGGLLAALGLAAGTTFTRGKNAEFSINGGETLRSASNTLTSGAHGISDLNITVTTEDTQTFTVAADTSAMREKIDAFVTAFNDVQQFIDTNTRISKDAKGRVSAAALASNREIQDWARGLRNRAFAAVTGGTVDRITDLGLDFKTGTNELKVTDASKLTEVLGNCPADVAQFFEQAGTGFSAQLESFVAKITKLNTDQQKRLGAANDSLTEQIAAMQRRLDQQRELMESAFMQMERAQSTLKQQQSTIDNMFAAKK